MNKEIDLRSLINDNLKCEPHDVSPSSLGNDSTINLIERPFEKDKKWNKKQKTNYIESIFLNCSLQPIIRFQNDNHTVIVDGYNRYSTVKSFFNNEFELDEKGLNQLKFLANKKYVDLNDNEKKFFNKNAGIKILDYTCESKIEGKDVLSEDEELEVLKYLYTLYNTGLKLQIEEIQRAQFYDDYITQKIKKKIYEEQEFLEKLETLKLYNGRRKRNKIDNILLNCRLLIASTYSNIYNFSYTYDLQTRIEENYLPNINNLNKNKIYEDFILNIEQVYNNLINTQKWKKYPNLHTKTFIEATYWLISIIRKDNLGDTGLFDFMAYLEYFGKKEDEEQNFDVYHSHYTKNIYKKYYVVAKYYEKQYGYNMDSYFEEGKLKNNSVEIVNNIEELYKRNFNFSTEKVKISDLLIQLKNSSYNIRPYYQRSEVMNVSLSSKIIESILLGIRIPYILMCDKYLCDSVVTEVVDGQQRLLSILGLFESPFMNENNELEYSNKNGYYLRNLRILSEYNGCSFTKKSKGKIIPLCCVNKIQNSYLYIYRAKDMGDNSFSTIDYFVRLNKKASLIKENTYKMFYLTCDRKIIEHVIKNTSEFLGNLLPKENSSGKPYLVTLRLSYLFYNKLENEINYSNYSNLKVGSWLNEFNKFKDKNIYINVDEIQKLRLKYFKAINDTKDFYIKLNKFLNKMNKSIRDLVGMNNFSYVPLSYYYYLFCLLVNISESDLLENSLNIYNIVSSFFSKIRSEGSIDIDIESILNFSIRQVYIYDTKRRLEFNNKLSLSLEKI